MVEPKLESIFDLPLDAATEAAADSAADAAIEAGNGVPHEHVRAWLMQLAKGTRVPPPAA